MTTPNQGAPDGSVTVGGGQFNYGQTVDENTFKAGFLFEPPTDLVGALELLPVILSQLPDGSMRPWQLWLGMTDSSLVNGEVQGELNDSLLTSPFRQLMDDITNTFFGGTTYNLTSNGDVFAALNRAYNTLQEQAKAFLKLSVRTDGTVSKGEAYTVDFTGLDTVEESGFEVTYSGAGASTLEVIDGVAQWRVEDRLPRDAMVVYSRETETDFQSVRGTLSAPPQPATSQGEIPQFYALSRVSPDRKSFVWARAYSKGLGLYFADVGCTVDGFERTWVTGVPLKWSLNLRFDAGVGTNPREYQLWSGTTVVLSHTEEGSFSALCDAGHASDSDHTEDCVKYRGWGAIAELRDGRDSGRVDATGVVDNTPLTVVGSTARMARLSNTPVPFEGGSALTPLPPAFFDEVTYESKDINAIPSTGVFSISRPNTYVVNARVDLSAAALSMSHLLLQACYDGVTWVTVQYGASVVPAGGEPLTGSWLQAMPAGSALRLAYIQAGVTLPILTGGAAGAKTYFSVAGIGSV